MFPAQLTKRNGMSRVGNRAAVLRGSCCLGYDASPLGWCVSTKVSEDMMPPYSGLLWVTIGDYRQDRDKIILRKLACT
jgi:hypothetical protein